MHASHTGPPAIDTVVGHSYGSTVLGGTATGGNDLAADNRIAVGSPGMLVDKAGDLNLPSKSQVYSMTARNDIIGLAADMTLGAEPFSEDFGAVRLWADPGPSWDPAGIIGDIAAHSSYWVQDNPGLANLEAIIAGRASRWERVYFPEPARQRRLLIRPSDIQIILGKVRPPSRRDSPSKTNSPVA